MKPENSQDQPTLKSLRESAQLTQPELSRRMNVGIRIIGDWERGQAVPRFDRAIALARELGVSLKSLAKSMRLDIADLPNDEMELKQLKAVCEELGIVRIDDLPNEWGELLKRSHTDET